MVAVTLYVEGGGKSRNLRAECRRSFGELIKQVVPERRMPKIVACGPRNDAFDHFQTALQAKGDAAVILLVDSEAPVGAGVTAWNHLFRQDGWVRPAGAANQDVHLMVECMEAWLLADPTAIAGYFGKGFNPNALPGQTSVENLSKATVFAALDAATRHAKTKGGYDKSRHSFALLALVSADKLRSASPRHAAGFFEHLRHVVGT